MAQFDIQHMQMVERQIKRRGIADARVIEAVASVPRELFVPDALKELAYEDGPVPIDEGHFVSQPYVIALMLEALRLTGSERVLEIGTGTGYSAALLSRLAARVYSVERVEALGTVAQENLKTLGASNVSVFVGDGTEGWPEHAPYDAILVSAGGPKVPLALCRQLEIGGHLIMPVGSDIEVQRLVRLNRRDANHFDHTDLGIVSFVPLIPSY